MFRRCSLHLLNPSMSRTDAPMKYWCFTQNNWTTAETRILHEVICKYIIFGKETAPQTGTQHLQGYVVFSTMKRLTAVKKILPTAHWEIARGTTQENVEYCSKEAVDVYVRGEQPKDRAQQAQAQKDHYADVIRAAKEGTVEEEYPQEFLRYHNIVTRMYQPQLATLTEYSAYWLVGPPGTGKSRYARWKYPGLYNKLINKWWDGYNHEETVLLDDFSKTNVCTGDALKNWADHYPFRAEVKGSSMMIRPKTIIVTSNYEIEDLFEDPTLQEALKRRFKIVRFSADYPWTPPEQSTEHPTVTNPESSSQGPHGCGMREE